MPDSTTPNYGFTKPEVGSSPGTWGDKLNDNWDVLDALLPDFLALAGGTMTDDIALGDPTPGGVSSAGFRGLPANIQNADYTLVLKDSGKHIYHTSASAHAWTIPPNASVAFPAGTVIVLINTGSGAVTITRGSGVDLRMAGVSTDANRTLGQYGVATLIKHATNSWIVSGAGLT